MIIYFPTQFLSTSKPPYSHTVRPRHTRSPIIGNFLLRVHYTITHVYSLYPRKLYTLGVLYNLVQLYSLYSGKLGVLYTLVQLYHYGQTRIQPMRLDNTAFLIDSFF